LDAEYYQPEYLEIVKNISSFSKPLSELVYTIKHPGEIERVYVDNGNPFILTQNINPSFFILQFNEQRFITEEQAVQIPQNKILEGDVLMTRTGANFGDSCIYLGGLDDNSYVSSHTLIIRPKISGEYLAVFFNSKIGRSLINRGVYGASQPEISPEYLKTLLVPVFNEGLFSLVSRIVKEAFSLIKLSENVYKAAENLLLEELGLKDYRPEESLSCVVNFSEVKEADRIDADYFQSKYSNLFTTIKSFENEKLGQLAKRIKTRIKINSDEVYKYIEISDVDVSSGKASFNEISAKDLPASAQIPIKGGELIISKVRPTRGAISILPDGFNNNFVCSSAFSVFEINEELKEYIFIVLRSIVGRLQFEKPTTGTSYPTITDQDVENVLVPILPIETQQKIADLVKQSHEARKKSKELLEEAKRKVEEMIEKGGE
jgi:restriction endonuclease S subunit